MTGTIHDLFTNLAVKQDFKDDWNEHAKSDWKTDFETTGGTPNNAPSYGVAKVNGNLLTLDWALLGSDHLMISYPLKWHFSVHVNGSYVSGAITSGVVFNDRVELTLGTPVIYSDTVTVRYHGDSDSDDLFFVTGLPIPDMADPVTAVNETPHVVTPTYTIILDSFAISGNQIICSLYNTGGDTLAMTTPEITDFTVKVNGNQVTISSVAITDDLKVTINLLTPVLSTDAVSLAYSPDYDPQALISTHSWLVANLDEILIENDTPSIASTQSITHTFAKTNTDGTAIILFYMATGGDTLAMTTPLFADFTVTVNSTPVDILEIIIDPIKVTVTLVLVNPVVYGDVVTVAYAKGSDSGKLIDINEVDISNLGTTTVPIYPDVPSITGWTAAVVGSNLTLTIVETGNDALAYANNPAIGDFLIHVNGNPVSHDSVTAHATTVVIVLTTPVIHSNTVLVSYTAGSDIHKLTDILGAQVADFSNHAVTNNT